MYMKIVHRTQQPTHAEWTNQYRPTRPYVLFSYMEMCFVFRESSETIIFFAHTQI